ncbi:sulfur oxidation c-type cytochrome SoxA [Hydrogenophilus islandicus]
MIRKKLTVFAALSLLGGAVSGAAAAADEDKSRLKAIEEYRKQIADGNPSDLLAMEGEQLWRTPYGPKNQSLEKCDLGLGPGVVKGAAARLPRYFPDTGRVQDLESRLITCMEQLQGVDPQKVIDAPWGKGEKLRMDQLVAYIVTESNGEKIQVDMSHPKMKEMYALGKKMFFYRTGPFDFSCATCHAHDGQRIRLQELPNLTKHEGAAAGWGSWPAYRVSNSQFWTMQMRLNDCFRQQRTAEPIYVSDATIALSVYMAANANGGVMLTPGIKR